MKEELKKYLFEKRKQRGQKRKIKSLIKNINEFEGFRDTSKLVEHFHVPSSQFISHKRTSEKIKNLFCERWLETTEKLIAQKPSELEFCKIVAMIIPSDYWSSQIIIFYDESYYNEFWEKNSDYQKWESLDKKNSFVSGRNINTKLQEKGYKEIICDEDFRVENFLWFYGELS